MKIIGELFSCKELDELEKLLEQQMEVEQLRDKLFAEFLKYSNYTNVTQWNKAVLLCECLAIIGWGKYEPVEAIQSKFFNGNPITFFRNKFSETRFVEAIWSKRKNGLTMEQGRTSYYFSPDDPEQKITLAWDYPTTEDIQDLKLVSQRNWIPKSPVLITRSIGNCYENSKAVIESIEKDLQPALNLKMQPEKYGKAINQIILNCSYSFYDNDCCKTNMIIADDKLKLKAKDFYPTLLTMYTKKEIEDNGFFLRNRFEFGVFSVKTGKTVTKINFEKAFSEQSHLEQKRFLNQYIKTAINTITEKLKNKKMNYNFDLMREDFSLILDQWTNKI